MPREYRIGWSAVVVYDADELEQGLAERPQLSKEIPGGSLTLRKMPPGYPVGEHHADVEREGKQLRSFSAFTLDDLMQQVQAALLPRAADEGVATDPNRRIPHVGGPYDGQQTPPRGEVFHLALTNTDTGGSSAAGCYRYDREADVYRWESGTDDEGSTNA